MIWRATGTMHGGSSVESGFEPETLRSRGRDLTTRPPRPVIIVGEMAECLEIKVLEAPNPSCYNYKATETLLLPYTSRTER
ncbi:hypothetical protein AVEN_115068-1 [Araneus ventricosus]|uniref:Uncharacterized protein n=1 Tax=Araneus ventricosus TaxID=182803 RepID=A0A4Y1ZXQ1_ARAVE|nr:hypothetical protein AVEN_115068-1 [Araneus ventricosus]